jgi:shikimate dehydrogenase
MITGKTTLIVHLGYPTEAFKAPMIYNPWFEMKGIDTVVVPVGVKAPQYATVVKSLFSTTNVHGALVTMPHKVTTAQLVDEITTTAKVAGACNAILRRADGSLLGDMFDGAGFVRGVERKGRRIAGARALVLGCGGVGSAIAASLAASGAAELGLFDAVRASAETLAARLLRAALDRGCSVQVGTDMLFEMIPAYLEFFGFGSTTPEELRGVATLKY